MRRNRGGNRMGNRGMGNQNSGGPRPLMGSSGPMMTDSLHLRELDLELELLKRKRQMIEEQHSMLTDSHSFGRVNQYGYEQQSQSFGQPARNFGNLYPESGGSRRGFGGPQGNKRPAIDPWDTSAPSPPKRFGGNQPARRNPNPSFRNERPSRPQQSNRAPFRGGARRDDKFAKPRNLQSKGVSKPKQNSAPPNKLKSLSTAERKNLVNQASDLVSKDKGNAPLVLEAEGPTHPKLVGRLELALGSVIREMRDDHGSNPSHADTFALGGRQRALKQAIRERLRQVMIGKAVGLNAEIIQIYRTTFPRETDLALLESIRESNKHTSEIAIKLVKQGRPEKYFKNNFARLLSVSLTEMFERVKKLYVRENETHKPLHELINTLLMELEESITEEEKQKLTEGTVNGTEADKPATEENSQAEGENTAQDETNQNEANPETEEVEISEVTVEPEGTDDNVASADAEQKTEESAEPEENKKLNTSGASAVRQVSEQTLLHTSRFYQRLIDTYLRKNLPAILPKYKEFIVDILNCDEAYKKTEAYIIQTTNERAKNNTARDNNRDEKAGDAAKKTTAKSAPKEGNKTPKPGARSSRHQYFAKVIGRPALPKKQVMKVFLDEFEPTLIKKHRNIHNILFISFDKKENFDNILARNGHVLDSKTLEIKASDKINKNTKEQQQEEKKETNTNEPSDLGSLDDQIDDLLTTIQQEEVEAQENGGTEGGEETGNTEQEGTEENAGNEEVQTFDEQDEATDAQEEHYENNQQEYTEAEESDQGQNGEETYDQAESNADQAESNAEQTENTDNAENTEDTSSQGQENNEPQKVAPGPKTTRAAAKVATSTPAKGPAAAKTSTPAKPAAAKAVGTPAKAAPGTPAKAATGTPVKPVTTATVRTRRASKLTQN